MNKNEVKQFIKEHKKEAIIIASSTFGGIVLIGLGVKCHRLTSEGKHILSSINRVVDLPKPDLGSIEVTEFWQEGDYMNLILNDCTVGDLDLLKEGLKNIPEVTEDTQISAIVGLVK